MIDDIDFESDNVEFWHAKWMLDGCKTLTEVADRLITYAEHMRAKHDKGCVLAQPVEDGHCVVYKSDE